jgi:PAT family beta-lactamase induction signal transducer AmpG
MPNSERLDTALFNRRTLMCVFTGFSSGLPFFILLNMLSAWFHDAHVDLKDIGLSTLYRLPYTWKFLWSPLVDRFVIGSRWGRRRGWMALTQLLLLIAIAGLGRLDPTADPLAIAALASGVALFSATQDIVLDAYRRELLPDAELALGNAVHVNAYRLDSLIPASLALILADHMAWSNVFVITALFMIPGFIATLFAPKEINLAPAPQTLSQAIYLPFVEFFKRQGWATAVLLLSFMFLYKLGDGMATTLATPFYRQLGFSNSEVGSIAKLVGLWCNLGGVTLGGIWMVRLGINRALWIFGALQLMSVLGFAWLAQVGHDRAVLGAVIGMEAFGVGLGTAALVAFIARTTDPRYTATQFALFTSFTALPSVLLGRPAADIVIAVGWPHYFYLCFLLGLPGMLLLSRVAPWNAQTKDATPANAA